MPGQPSSAGSACPQCGTGLPDSARFCDVCGASLSGRTAAPSQPVASPPHPFAPALAGPTGSDQVQLAGRGVRCSSFLLDVAAMMSPALPLSIAGAVLGVAEVIYIVLPVAFASVWGWMQVWQGLTGTSFGKAMLGLRMIRAGDDRPPGVAASIFRSGLFIATLGMVAVPVVASAVPRIGPHDKITGVVLIDVTLGANPLGLRQQTTLRRSPARGLNRVQSPIPSARLRRG